MKYENFDHAKEIKEKIDDLKLTLEKLSGDYMQVNVINSYTNVISISTSDRSVSNFKDLASKFINDLKISFENKICELNKELEIL